MGLRWVLASAAAVVAAAACCPPAGAIVGGSAASIEALPYQVALVNSVKTAVAGEFCGGSIRDELHVITAAHCVLDTSQSGAGQPVSPDRIHVLAGVANLEDEASGQRLEVDTISFDSAYDSGTLAHDAALLTLEEPLALSATTRPIPLIDDDDWADVARGAPLVTAGWGKLGDNSYPDELQAVSVGFITDSDCTSVYLWPSIARDTQVCAAAPGKDTCNGDSGGPLVRPEASSSPDGDRLVGIVSGGDQVCANPNFPGLYTEVANPAIRSFLLQDFPVAAPTYTTAPSLSGATSVGGQLTCARGRWTGSPSFRYEFIRSTPGGADIAVVADSASPSYPVGVGDAGMALRCRVIGTNPGGASSVETGRVSVAGVSSRQQQPSQPIFDADAPVARITKTLCTNNRCTLTVVVTDVGFSAGIARLDATVKSRYVSTCTKRGRRVKCTKTATGRPSVAALSATSFQVTAAGLPIGSHLFSLLAVDKAGHAQALATRTTLTTRKQKKATKSKRR